jgi:hypothetical protein
MYFMSRCQHTSKVPHLKFPTLIQFGNLAFLLHRNNQKRLWDPDVQYCTDIIELKDKIAMLTLQLDYSVLDKSHKITYD